MIIFFLTRNRNVHVSVKVVGGVYQPPRDHLIREDHRELSMPARPQAENLSVFH